MKITRYFQSCLLIEDSGARLAIDISGQDADIEKFGKLDAVLYTHQHGDHFDPELAEKLAGQGITIYANASTAKQMKSQPNIVEDGQKFKIGGLEVSAHELPHCLMIDGSAGPQNTGYLIGGRLFHPGDGKELEGLHAEILAMPITGPDISLKDAHELAVQVGAKSALPIHYDFIGTKPEVLNRLSGEKPYEVHILELGQPEEI